MVEVVERVEEVEEGCRVAGVEEAAVWERMLVLEREQVRKCLKVYVGSLYTRLTKQQC